ncbi:MAG: biotin-dependent carboxyltransferase family protein [Acidobacteriota bacterium]|nr:biotin-dependent carboxyltransferase family protein [Acidobacteriota bacterium]
MIQILDPGLLTTVQDCGRWGYQSLGVPVSGPMDRVSHVTANRLVGNESRSATLEVTLHGPRLAFLADTTFAVAGARFELWLDTRPVSCGVAYRAPVGSELGFGRRRGGARAYVAVAGGVDIPRALGSRSTDLASGLGGLGGRALRAGDRLDVGSTRHGPPMVSPLVSGTTLPDGGATVRVLAGPDFRLLTSDALAELTRNRFKLASVSNRMAYRFEGPRIELACTQGRLSTPTPMGTLQVPPSGHPILLMADRQTTGGYDHVATVISADLPVAGQLAPGDWMTFRVCERRDALAALITLEQKRALGPVAAGN